MGFYTDDSINQNNQQLTLKGHISCLIHGNKTHKGTSGKSGCRFRKKVKIQQASSSSIKKMKPIRFKTRKKRNTNVRKKEDISYD